MTLLRITVALAFVLLSAHAAFASELNPTDVASLTFDRHVGAQLPLDLSFVDENGEHVSLRQYFASNTPVLLSLNYFTCQYLCPIETEGLINGLNGIGPTLGSDYTLLTVSIDAQDGPSEASAFKARGLRNYDRPQGDDGWHLLTADQSTLNQLEGTIGFNALHDPQQADFAHPVGVVMLTPGGTISNYLYGIDFDSSDLAHGLATAATSTADSPFTRALLICFQYDPLIGTNTQLALNALRIGGAVTLLVVIVVLGKLWRDDLARGRA